MKLYGHLSPEKVLSYVQTVHQHATKKLELQEGTYYAAVYCTGVSDEEMRTMELPKGTILVCNETLSRLLSAFTGSLLVSSVQSKSSSQKRKRSAAPDALHS
jgi:hypothetical protein